MRISSAHVRRSSRLWNKKAKEMGIPVLDEKVVAKVLAGEVPPELGG